MKTLAFGLLFSSLALATPVEVDELDLGACWLHSSDATARIASFNDGVALTVSKDGMDLPGILSAPQLNKQITAALRKLGFTQFPTSRYDLFVYCSGLGTTFLVNLHDGNVPLCAWAKAGKGGWNITGLFSNHNAAPNRLCLGQQSKELLVSIKETAKLDDVKAYLMKNYGSRIEKIEPYVPGQFLHVFLKKSEQFQENRIKGDLEKDETLKGIVTEVSYNSISTIVGEGRVVLSSEFKFE